MPDFMLILATPLVIFGVALVVIPRLDKTPVTSSTIIAAIYVTMIATGMVLTVLVLTERIWR